METKSSKVTWTRSLDVQLCTYAAPWFITLSYECGPWQRWPR